MGGMIEEHLARLWTFVHDVWSFDRRRFVLAALLVILGTAAEMAGVALLLQVLSLVSGKAGAGSRGAIDLMQAARGTGRLRQLAVVLVLIAVAMILRTVLLARRQLAVAGFELDYLRAKQTQIVRVLADAPWDKVARLRHARINHMLGYDVYRIGLAATGLLQSIAGGLILMVQLAIAAWIEPRLTAVVVVVLFLGGLASFTFLRAANRLGHTVTDANVGLLNDAGQFLGALKVARSQNLDQAFVTSFEAGLQTINQAEFGFLLRQSRMRMRATVAASIAGLAIAFVGFGPMGTDPARVIVLLVILTRMAAPAMQIQIQAIEMMRSLPAFEALQSLKLDLAPPVADEGIAVRPAPAFAEIRFERVSFKHGGGETGGGVRDLSMTISPGEFLGVMGQSGAGKTTLADLLVGLYEPDEGVIRVDGEVQRLSVTPGWRAMIAYVAQDAFLRHDTVRANLVEQTGIDDARLAELLRLTGADSVVARLPEGLDTQVGERGSLISGGERQRLALVRALARAPQLLILDEATNAIDPAGEAELLARLDDLRPGLTIVSIAHRAESLRLCERVVAMEGGEIVDVRSTASDARCLTGVSAVPATDDITS
jgi:ATP-binding cassette subfamily C protein